MAAVLIDFATRRVIPPPPGPMSQAARLALHRSWNCQRNRMIAARYDFQAAHYRAFVIHRDDADASRSAAEWTRARRAYDDARVALMATPAADKKGVAWKWKQLEDLASRRSEWEDALDVDEVKFGMREGRPKIAPPPPPKVTKGILTSEQRSVLVEHIAAAITELGLTPTR